jgi:ABC-type multidrug transport system ATPase subunit
VEELLNSLGLAYCAEAFIGSDLVRGVSGGEQKRVAIGVEIITNPSILFLDEPTSGLDSFNAWKIIHILKALAGFGCSILCTIHQPSSETFALFDVCILLAHGQVVFNGQVERLTREFANVGCKLNCPHFGY